MYDDGTFIIIRNNNAEQISGTYTNASNYIILTVDKSSGDSPKLELEVTDSGIKVESSDIGGYDPGDEGKLTEGAPPSGGQESPDSNISYSLGDAPKSDPLPEDKYHIDEEISEGIYITFDVPKAETYWTTRVYIEGLGPVAEEIRYTDESKTKGCFFYPFVEAGKEYTIRVVFLREEDQDNEGFVLNYKDDDGVIGWFQTNVTAGSKSKGEVRFTSKGKIDVKKNGDFRFTEKPTFQNENLLGGKWEVEIGLVEGVSWVHGAERRTNWREAVVIKYANLTNKCNLFELSTYPHGIDFICVRPILYYEHDSKTYKYQWDSFVQDIFYPSKSDRLIPIDINNQSQISKIYGTWKFETGWNYDSPFGNTVIPIKVKQNKKFIISSNVQNLEYQIIEVITKRDDGTFTQEEENHFIANYDNDTSKAMSKISDDRKTITQQYWAKTTLSKYFENQENDDYTLHYELKLFEDNDLQSELWVFETAKKYGDLLYSYRDPYYKQ